MSEITVCPGGACPRKQNCYRFKAEPDKYMQSWFVDAPLDENDMTCTYFMPINLEKALEEKK